MGILEMGCQDDHSTVFNEVPLNMSSYLQKLAVVKLLGRESNPRLGSRSLGRDYLYQQFPSAKFDFVAPNLDLRCSLIVVGANMQMRFFPHFVSHLHSSLS